MLLAGPTIGQAQQPKDDSPTATSQPVGEPLDTTRGFRGAGVQTLDDLRSLVIEGPSESVDALSKIIAELDRLSIGSEAAIEVVRLVSADSESLTTALREIYESRQSARPQTRQRGGQVAFVAIAQPNAVVVIAPAAEVDEVITFVQELDRGSKRTGEQYRIFRLKRANAVLVRDRLIEFFQIREDDANLRLRLEVVADERTNSLIVQGGPTDIEQAARLIEELDASDSDTVNEIRIFPLKFAQASGLADLINQSIAPLTPNGAATSTGSGAGAQRNQGRNNQRAGGNLGLGTGSTGSKSTRLKLTTTDDAGRFIESGILEDISVTADLRTNSLVVTAPPQSMSLVAGLIEQLDRGPGPGQAVRVFTLQTSNAEELLSTLQQIFTSSTTTGTGQSQALNRPQATNTSTLSNNQSTSQATLASLPVRFTPDYRTNSIIASGSEEDLLRVEEIILRLDAQESKQRETLVYHLKNLTAFEAVQALNDYLTRERLDNQITVIAVQQDRSQQDQSQGVVNASANTPTADRTPLEPQSNGIIITANPGLLESFLRVVEEIDQRPSQVVIQVLIAQIELDNNDELGIEVGFQNDALFDRSLIVGNQGLGRDTLNPGLNFNNAPFQSPTGVDNDLTGLQGLSNFALGRTSPLGYGGLVFAASSDNISVLLRALKRQRRLDVLSRPQVMTLDNQQASIQIGQRIRVPTGSVTSAQGGTTSTFQREDIGIILAVTPRISPDGSILMRVAPQISSLQRDSSGAIEGLPVGVAADQSVVETPIINITQAVTTIGARDGETVVIGGLITKSTAIEERKVPFLGDIPYAEWLFKTRFRGVSKRELLIVMTPHIVANEWDADRVKQIESCRIDWITGDVNEVHGEIGVVCPPDPNDQKKCHPNKEFGPVLNMPGSEMLPRNMPKHKRPKEPEAYCPPAAPIEPGVEVIDTGGTVPIPENMQPVEEYLPPDAAVPDDLVVPNEASRPVDPPPPIAMNGDPPKPVETNPPPAKASIRSIIPRIAGRAPTSAREETK